METDNNSDIVSERDYKFLQSENDNNDNDDNDNDGRWQ